MNYINGKLLIANIYDEFNIHSRDWENRSNRWMFDALQALNITVSLGDVTKSIDFTDHKFKLPCRNEVVRGIFINGNKLDETNVIGFEEFIYTNTLPDSKLKYYKIVYDQVYLELESGTANIVYTELPLEWDESLQIYFPLIPDTFEVKANIKWYILKILLARGYKHEIYSLTTNNPFNNPAVQWENTKKLAMRSVRSLTLEKRKQLASIMTEFLSDSNTDKNDLISELYNR